MIEYKLGKDRLTGKIISVDDVSRGISCNCICPDCELNFVAAKGEKNRWHFRHFEKTECNGGQETALHLLAKEIITANNQIILPVYGKISYVDAIPEQYFRTIKPDVSAYTNGQSFFFEILVTHATGGLKDDFYITGGYKSVEINLKNYNFINRKELENKILKEISNKRIIFWNNENAIEKKSDKNMVIITLVAIGSLAVFLIKIIINLLQKRNKTYSKKRYAKN